MPGWRDQLADSRRSIWQVIGVYLVAGWAVYQVALGLTDGLGLPDWVPPLALVLIAAGLPVVITTALVQRSAPREPAFDPTLFPDAGDVVPASARASRLHHVLTWRRSILAGVGAFASLMLATAGFMAMRHFGIGPAGTLLAQGVLAEGQRVVLADFAGDSVLGSVVTEALRIDLSQSDVLRLEDPALLREPLARMQHDAAEGLPEAVARELAVREGYRAVIAGEIATLGGAYVLTARVVRADSGIAVASFKSVAKDSTQLIDAVEDMSRQIRGKAGESLRDVRAAPPLEQATTASLPALRKFSDAIRLVNQTGDNLRAAALLEEVVALDSTFGMAWRRLGIMYANSGIRSADRDRAFERAYALRDRMSEVERQVTIATYSSYIALDSDATIEAYRRVLELDPRNYVATNNLPVELLNRRRPREAEQILLTVPEADRTGTHWTNLVEAQVALDREAEARATLARAREFLPDNINLARVEFDLAIATRAYSSADSLVTWALDALRDNRSAVLGALRSRILLYAMQGRLREASAVADQYVQIAQKAGSKVAPYASGISEAEVRRWMEPTPAGARALLERTLARFPMDSLQPQERNYLALAGLYADFGEHERAQAFLERHRAERPPVRFDADYEFTAAYLELRRGDAAGALPAIRKDADEAACRLCSLPVLSQVYETLGQPDSARVILERFLTTPDLDRIWADAYFRAYALERAAELHEQAGDRERAIARYAELTQLLKRADPELQARVRAAGERIMALRGRG